MLNKCKTIKKIWLFFGIVFTISVLFKTDSYATDMPKIVLESYNIVEGSFELGKQSTLRLKLRNMHASLAVENILITYTCDEGKAYCAFGSSNQIFINKIKPKDVVSEDICLFLSEKIEGTNVPIKFDVTYTDSKSKESFADSFSINVPINGMNFVKEVSVASSTTQDAKTFVSATLENAGTSMANDLKMIVEGDVYTEKNEDGVSKKDGKIEFELGDLANGKGKYYEKAIMFKDIGKQDIRISFEYKNKDKDTVTELAGDYSVNVIGKKETQDKAVFKLADSKISIVWIICSFVGIVAAIVMIVFAAKVKKE